MEISEYSYWHYDYISCEGNERWGTVRAPSFATEYDVETNIEIGGCGDDIAEIIRVYEIYPENEWDYGIDICYKFE